MTRNHLQSIFGKADIQCSEHKNDNILKQFLQIFQTYMFFLLKQTFNKSFFYDSFSNNVNIVEGHTA